MVRSLLLRRAVRQAGIALCTAATSGLAGCHHARSFTQISGDDYVNVGYQARAQADLTGSVASVTSAEITPLRAFTLEEILRQRVSGVQVVRLATGALSIRIRGAGTMGSSGDPLVVIDGRPASANEISLVAPGDIESVSVIKDATASIYGSRGANGVILISTRRNSQE